MQQEGKTIQSVNRALQILSILQQESAGLGVTEISHRLDVSKSTAHRLLSSLKMQGFVQQDEASEYYRLGLKLLELGESVAEDLDIRQVASSPIHALAEQTGETVHIGVQDHEEVVYIDKVEKYATIRMYSAIGKRAPLYCTGIGKLLLAYETEEKIREMYAKTDLKAYTSHTITDMDELVDHVKTIREQKFSVDWEEHEEGVRCVAAPIYNHKGEVVAAVSVAGASNRMTEEKLGQCKQEVRHSALEISRRLGYTGQDL